MEMHFIRDKDKANDDNSDRECINIAAKVVKHVEGVRRVVVSRRIRTD